MATRSSARQPGGEYAMSLVSEGTLKGGVPPRSAGGLRKSAPGTAGDGSSIGRSRRSKRSSRGTS